MHKKNAKRRLEVVFIPALFFIGLLLVVEAIVFLLNIPEYLFPRPTRVFLDIISSFNSLMWHTSITMAEAVAGYIVGNILGFVTAVIFAHYKTIERGFYPYAIALKTTPIIAIAPLLVLWFGTDVGSKIAASAIICFFPILVNTVKGLKNIDDVALDLFRSLSATRWHIFTKLRLPNALPYIFSALRISTGLAVVGAIVGEFVGANKGIGYVILISTYHLETVRMFAAISMVAFGGVLFFLLVSFIEKKVLFWQKSQSPD
ncbi:MAG: ABC transporter permease [Candidatus Aenigmatarchaeota archaeon]